ncbi:MAG: protein kinase [Polyangiaceae bacterium]|nr:protein kinase [Polyangiaceae bacterium]
MLGPHSPLPVQIGDLIAGKYRVERFIGRGGMGIVIAGRHVELDELRAIKLMNPAELRNTASAERFVREARNAVRLKSEHVAKVHDIGRLDSGAPFIVMEYLEGLDLFTLLQKKGPQPMELAVLYVLQACDAIAEAHAAGIVHRDLKPANLFLTTRRDGSACVKVLDFGLSKLTGRRLSAAQLPLTETNDVMGTPYYMSPEQLRSTRNVDGRADIWALGVILYELITGKRPFPGATLAEVHAGILERDPKPPSALKPDLPAKLEGIILRCLLRERHRRIGTVEELIHELEPWVPIDAPPSSGRRVGRISDRPSRPDIGPASPRMSKQRSSDPPAPADAFAPTVPQKREIEAKKPAKAAEPKPVEVRAPARERERTALPKDRREPQKLAWRDLRGQDFSGKDLAGADFTGADLSNAKLIGADLTGAVLREARLSGADLSFANLLGADLRSAKLDGARFFLAKLIGVRMHPGALAGCETFGAALPDAPRIEPAIAPASPCESLVFHPSGILLASVHGDGTARLWGAVLGLPIRTISASSDIRSIALSPDGRALATGCTDGSIFLWDLGSGSLLRSLTTMTTQVHSLAWSPDGAAIAVGLWDGSVKICDAATGTVVRALPSHSKEVRVIAYSPNGALIATGSADGTVFTWDLPDFGTHRVLLRRSKDRAREVRSLAFTPDGATLAVAVGNGSIHVFDAARGTETSVLHDPTGGVQALAYSPSGQLASASADERVRVWDPRAKTVELVLEGHHGSVACVAWSPDGSMLATGSANGTLRLWNVFKEGASNEGGPSALLRRTFTGHDAQVFCAAFSPDGSSIASGGGDKAVRLWSASSGSLERALAGHSGAIASLAYRPMGDVLVTGSADRTAKLWDTLTGAEAASLVEHDRAIRSVAVSPDGGLLATGSLDKTVRLWKMPSGAPLYALQESMGALSALAWSPDGSKLAAISEGSKVFQWDFAASFRVVGAGRTLAERSLRGEFLSSLVYSRDSGALALGCQNGKTLVVNLAGENVIGTFVKHASAVRSVAFSPDGSLLATGSDDKTAALWDVTTKTRRFVLAGHLGGVRQVAWRSDGAVVATASLDGSIRLWKTASGECVGTLLGLPEGWVACTPDGRYKTGGDVRGAFWHVVGLCRFEVGELDPYVSSPLRIEGDAPLFGPAR